MGLFQKIFGKAQSKKQVIKNIVSEVEIEQKNAEFITKFDRVKELFILSLNIYNSEFCQCAYPRFHQIIGIDCTGTGYLFKCYDTDLLINLSKTYFEVDSSQLNDECTNEKWTCKKCGSSYEYGWSDFSIYLERQKLKLTKLMIEQKGKPPIAPIPLCLGLMGPSYPLKSEMIHVGFEEFEKYMTEQ